MTAVVGEVPRTGEAPLPPFEVPRQASPGVLHLAGEAGVAAVAHSQAEFDTDISPYRVDRKPEALIRGLYDKVAEQRVRDGGTYNNLAAVVMDSDSPYADVYRYVEAREFKIWYPGKTPEAFAEEMHVEYGPYEKDSHFVLLMDMENKDEDGLPVLVGMARAVGGSAELLKTVNDMPGIWGISKEEILADITKCDSEACTDIEVGDPATTWDFSSLAVTKAYRRTDAYQVLSHELYNLANEHGITAVTTIFVEKFFKLYQHCRVPFRAIADAPAKEHMEEVSVPAVMHLPETRHLASSTDPRDKAVWMLYGDSGVFNHFRAVA